MQTGAEHYFISNKESVKWNGLQLLQVMLACSTCGHVWTAMSGQGRRGVIRSALGGFVTDCPNCGKSGPIDI